MIASAIRLDLAVVSGEHAGTWGDWVPMLVWVPTLLSACSECLCSYSVIRVCWLSRFYSIPASQHPQELLCKAQLAFSRTVLKERLHENDLEYWTAFFTTSVPMQFSLFNTRHYMISLSHLSTPDVTYVVSLSTQCHSHNEIIDTRVNGEELEIPPPPPIT